MKEDYAVGRTCTKCGEYKTEEFFNKRNGVCRSICKLCVRKHNEADKDRQREVKRAYAATHPELFKESQMRWQERNPGLAAERAKAHYYSRPIEEHRANSAHWRERNRESCRESNRKWYQNNLEKVSAKRHRRRARVKGADGCSTAEDIKIILVNQKYKCSYCGHDILESFHMDHKTSLANGGSNWPENLQGTCGDCNTQKGAKNHPEYLVYLENVFPDKYANYLKHQEYIETLRLLSDWRI